MIKVTQIGKERKLTRLMRGWAYEFSQRANLNEEGQALKIKNGVNLKESTEDGLEITILLFT